MPSILKCRIIRARILGDVNTNFEKSAKLGSRNDGSSNQIPVYCEVKFGEQSDKSKVFEREEDVEAQKLTLDFETQNQQLSKRWSIRQSPSKKRESFSSPKNEDNLVHGKLSDSLFRFDEKLDDESIQDKSLEIRVRQTGTDNLIGLPKTPTVRTKR